MAEMKEIHDFAVKWCDKFRNQSINYIELVDHYMADDCKAVGFKMDCGYAFFEKYGQAVSDYEALDKIIDNVKDIPLLGSAIYSRWRYFNHWADSGMEILELQNRAWFILALSRLAILSGENPFIFQGTLKKMRIVSNKICYGPRPERDEEVEQHLTINDEGGIWFSGYNYGYGEEHYEKGRTYNFKIEKTSVDRLFSAISTYFSNSYDEVFATDIGNWDMELTNTDGKIYKFRGSLCADFDYEGIDLSDLVRESTGMNDLFVFDGNDKPDIITKIILDYHISAKIKANNESENVALKLVTWDYIEHLIIDRKTGTLEHIQNIGTNCKISHKYEVADEIENILDHFDADVLFSHIDGNPTDVIKTPDEIKNYKITIQYKKKPQRIIEGRFDKNGLPDDFDDFVEAVLEFIRFYGMGEIFDPSVYGKVNRRLSEYIYCSVIFDENYYKSYYYLADEDIFRVDDFVVVPVGKYNDEEIAKIVKIEYFNEGNVPLPVTKTKHIIRKCTDDDFDL